MNTLSKTLHVLGWTICVVSVYFTFVVLSSFWEGVGWAGAAMFIILKFYLPACILLCIGPAGYLAYKTRSVRDRRSFWLAVIPTILLPIAIYLALQFAPQGGGC